ncbi:c-type cytochrome [Candidatus Magnetominusculus dajiuhuensis]|uniref:c-type cytochrome n=1 Tax=Candidatus Magnetominusculus dajiuhuensis TaxID=3137712 RepID=UPI0019EEA2C0|nr:cytochrome c5 family protein [Nitrospirota bacterium]
MKKIFFTVAVLVLVAMVPAYGADGKAVFDKVCTFCHKTGRLTAPVFGDKELWAPRIAKGKDTLYQHAINGHGMMPAKGGEATLSDDEVKATVDYMVSESK